MALDNYGLADLCCADCSGFRQGTTPTDLYLTVSGVTNTECSSFDCINNYHPCCCDSDPPDCCGECEGFNQKFHFIQNAVLNRRHELGGECYDQAFMEARTNNDPYPVSGGDRDVNCTWSIAGCYNVTVRRGAVLTGMVSWGLVGNFNLGRNWKWSRIRQLR